MASKTLISPKRKYHTKQFETASLRKHNIIIKTLFEKKKNIKLNSFLLFIVFSQQKIPPLLY